MHKKPLLYKGNAAPFAPVRRVGLPEMFYIVIFYIVILL